MRHDAPQAKLGLLTIVMVALLAASVALAWMVSRPERDTSPGGAEVISKLTNDTLEGYWTGERREDWFIGRTGRGKAIGWQKRSRGREPKGLFAGSIVVGGSGDTQYDSGWILSPDLSKGSYQARVFLDRGQVVETQILLRGDKITVTRSLMGRKVTATAAKPANYVPEGALPLIVRLVAARGDEATFKMIFDEQAIVRGKVNFVNVRVAPIGRNAVRVSSAQRKSAFATVYHLDSNHEIDHYEYPNEKVIYRRSKKVLVEKTFGISNEGPTIKARP